MTGKPKIISSMEFEKEETEHRETPYHHGYREMPLPKIPRNKGMPLFDEETEHLLYAGRDKPGLVKESTLSSHDGQIILEEYDYNSEAKTYMEPSTNFCLSIFSSFFCFVVGMFAISHSIQSHYYKEAGLLSLADSHGSKAAQLSVVAIIMGLIIVMWITIIRIMLADEAA